MRASRPRALWKPAVSVLILALLSWLVFVIGFGRKAADTGYAEAIEESRGYVRQLHEAFEIPGMAVAVAIDGRIVWSEGFGVADREKQVRATPQTLFRVGSVSKILTAGAVALLYEQGRLDLDAPVQKYVPEFPDKGPTITTRQIAGHLSGIRHYNEDEKEDKKHYDDVISALALFRNDPLQHPPGEKWSYSSYGWNLISAVVERAANQSFLDYMRAQVFAPLEMRHTVPDEASADAPNRATFYEGREVAPKIDVSYKWASGGFLSSAEDLARYGSAYLPGSRFLKPETLQVVLTNQRTNDGTVVRHGIGWLVDKLENGKPLYHHVGSMIGGQAVLVVQPADRVVVAMVANRSGGFGELAANRVACSFLGLEDDECPEIQGERKRRLEKHARMNLLHSAVENWASALEQGKLSALMETYSENFQSVRWKNKAAMSRHFQQVFASGPTDVDTENLHLRFRSLGYPIGALTYIEGIKTKGALGNYSIRLTMIREESGPAITNMEFVGPGDE